MSKSHPKKTRSETLTSADDEGGGDDREDDVVLLLKLHDTEAFDALSDRLFREKTNVARFFTMVVIRTAKTETAIAL